MTIYEGKLTKPSTVLDLNKSDRRKARRNAIDAAVPFLMQKHQCSRAKAEVMARVNYDRFLADLRRNREKLVVLA